MPIFNDLNLDNWKESEIWTDSLWIIQERDKSGKHNGFYHGNFVPQIPRQLILRDNKKYFSEIILGDSSKNTTFDEVSETLKKQKKKNISLAILHPPYADIIKFSNLKDDLSNAKSLKDFLNGFSLVLKNTISILEKGRYLAIVIGDKYTAGQWIPLGFYCMNEAQKLGLTLKSIIIKNMAGNRAKQNKERIWRYRALSSDYYIFKHEYILIFKK